MGSRPSKVAPARSRSGLSFVSTSSTESLDTIATELDNEPEGVTNFSFDEVSVKSFQVRWDPPQNFDPVSYQVRLFPPDKIKSRTLLRGLVDTKHTFTRLKSSTQYNVAVAAIDANGNKSPCSTATVWTAPRPPRDIQFLSIRSDCLQIHWKHCKGRPGTYDVDVFAEDESEPVAQAKGLHENNHLFKNMTSGSDYTVTVKNVANGQSSEPLIGTFLTAPRYICDITFSDVTQHEMTLQWKKPEGRIDSYTLEMSEDIEHPGEPIQIEGLKKTFYTFNGLTPGRLYSCKIWSKVKHKLSRPQIFTQCTVPLEVAGVATRDTGPEEVLVTWAAAMGDSDDYDLFLNPKKGVVGETAPRGIKETQYKFTGLVPGTAYTVAVVTNSKDKSSKRVVSSFITVPGMSGDIDISAAERTCTTQGISWPPASGRVDSYTITIRKDKKEEDDQVIKDVFKPHQLLTGLSPGTLYRVEVAAMRDGRESSSMNTVFGTVPSPVPSVFFSWEQCSWDQITCSWDASSGGVEHYLIEAKCEEGATKEATVSFDRSDYLFASLHPSTEYEFSVSVVSNGIKSDPKTATQTTGPSSINDFHVKSNDKTELFASWNPPEHGADEYVIKLLFLEDEGNLENPLQLSTPKQEHTFTGLIPGSLYEVEIIPYQSSIKGKPHTVEAYTKPGNAMNVHIPGDLVTSNSITITWCGVEGNCKDVDVILTRIKKGQDEHDGPNPLVIKEEHVYAKDEGPVEVVFTSLDPNTVYGIRLRAVGKSGVGTDAVFTQATLCSSQELSEEMTDEINVEERFDTAEEPQPKEAKSDAAIDPAKIEFESKTNSEISITETNVIGTFSSKNVPNGIDGPPYDDGSPQAEIYLSERISSSAEVALTENSTAETSSIQDETAKLLFRSANSCESSLKAITLPVESDLATSPSPNPLLEQDEDMIPPPSPVDDLLISTAHGEQITSNETDHNKEVLGAKVDAPRVENKDLEPEKTESAETHSPRVTPQQPNADLGNGADINSDQDTDLSLERRNNLRLFNHETNPKSVSPIAEKNENRLSFLATLASAE